MLMLKRHVALVADDDPIARKLFTDILESLGFSPVCVGRADPWPDDVQKCTLAVVDHSAWSAQGQDILADIDARIGTHVPLVLTAPGADRTQCKRDFDAGRVEVHAKPIEPAEFVMALNRAMGWSEGRRIPKRAPALLVEEVRTTALILSKLLDVLGVPSLVCASKAELEHHMQVVRPELVIADMYLTGSSGIDVCRAIRSEHRMDELPIVIISGNTRSTADVVECLRAGANDHLSKPILKEEFFARISNILKIRSLQKDLHKQQKRLEELAFTDPLTGLFNRAYMTSALQREADRSRRSGQPLGFIIMDLDHFKQVNDTYGHETGDEVLSEFAALLQRSVRSYDIVCRYGGEEFCVILPNTGITHVGIVAERIRQNCENTTLSKHDLHKTVSIGGSEFPAVSNAPDNLVSDADAALYRAKETGRNKVVLAEPDSVADTA